MTKDEILDYRIELRILNIEDAVVTYNALMGKRGVFNIRCC